MLSILMPAKNEARYIEAALHSVAKIKTGDFEVIIVDDGSSDDTCQVVKTLGFDFVRLIESGGVGKARAFTLAYESAKGDTFILLAADDLLVAENVEARISPIKSQDSAAISFCRLKSFSETTKYHGMELPKNSQLGLESGGCMAFNRAFGDMAFPIPDYLPNEDVWLTLHARYLPVNVTQVPKLGILYRIHDNNSYKRGAPYSQINEQMWLRQRALFYFYELYKSELSPLTQRKILTQFLLQLTRYLGFTLTLLILPEAPLKDRIKMLLNSSSLLYSIRERFYNFFSGR